MTEHPDGLKMNSNGLNFHGINTEHGKHKFTGITHVPQLGFGDHHGPVQPPAAPTGTPSQPSAPLTKEYKAPMGLSMPVLKPVALRAGGAGAAAAGASSSAGVGVGVGPLATGPLMGGGPTGILPHEDANGVPEDPQMAQLKSVRKRCVLNMVPAAIAVQTFKFYAQGGKLKPETFRKAYDDVLKKCRLEPPNVGIMDEVFQLFDKDHDGTVDTMELCCGIALFCQGTEEEKIHAIFDCFDSGKGETSLTNDELWVFLTAIFKVIMTPRVLAAMAQMGFQIDSAEDLASITTLECFRQGDIDSDGKLNIEEFKTWFYAPKNDPTFMFNVGRLLQ